MACRYGLIGLILLAWLVGMGIDLTLSLLAVVLIDYIVFTLQAKYFVGRVEARKVLLTFVYIFFGNRFMLWVLYETLGLHITVAQIISKQA